jgi:hypothetical protein
MGGGEMLPELPPPRHPRRKGVIVGISAAATILVTAGVITIVEGSSGSGSRHPLPPAAASAPVSSAPVTTTPTTAAPVASPVLLASNSQGARYSVAPSAAFTLVPTSSCWVQVRTGTANGPVVFQGTMHVGDRLPLPTNTPVWLRLGNPPGVSIVVNGTPLHLVTPNVPQPYNLEFQPAS